MARSPLPEESRRKNPVPVRLNEHRLQIGSNPARAGRVEMPNLQSEVVVRRGMTLPRQALSDAGPYREAPCGPNPFKVFSQETLPAGPGLAAALLASCDADFATLKGWFGTIPGGLPF